MTSNLDPGLPAVISVAGHRPSAVLATTMLLAAIDPKLPRLSGD